MELQPKNNIKEYLGNHEILDLLINNIKKNILQNSIILYGSEGIGKSTFAKIQNSISKHFYALLSSACKDR